MAFGKATAKMNDPSLRPATRGIANIHGYHEATVEFIAYSAMLVNLFFMHVICAC